MEDRLIELEERIAYQEKLISELDEVVITFSQKVEDLERYVKSRLSDEGETDEPHNTPPPHY